MSRTPEDRPLSRSEIDLLHWLVDHGAPDAAQYKPQISKLRVVSRCGCGCPTVDFAIGVSRTEGPSHLIADVEGESPEGVRIGVIVHVRDGEISELEVYSLTGESKRFSLPMPSSLVA
jgi:hypothetical protein